MNRKRDLQVSLFSRISVILQVSLFSRISVLLRQTRARPRTPNGLRRVFNTISRTARCCTASAVIEAAFAAITATLLRGKVAARDAGALVVVRCIDTCTPASSVAAAMAVVIGGASLVLVVAVVVGRAVLVRVELVCVELAALLFA